MNEDAHFSRESISQHTVLQSHEAFSTPPYSDTTLLKTESLLIIKLNIQQKASASFKKNNNLIAESKKKIKI